MKSVVLYILIFCFSSISFAQWKTSGSVGFEVDQFSYDLGDSFDSTQTSATFAPRLDYKSNFFKFKSDIRAQDQIQKQENKEPTLLQIKNFYIEVPQSQFQTRWGYQTLQIDGPDFVNPANAMHAQNWSQPSDPLTLSSLGISFSFEQSIWQVEFLYVPLQTHPQLPSHKSPWWPRQKRFMIESEDTELLLGQDIEYQIKDIEIIEEADRNNSTLVLKQKSESIESQFVFYNGLAMNPFLLTELNAQVVSIDPKQVLLLESPILLKPIGYRHTLLAATFLIPFESWSIKGGAQSSRPSVDDPRLPKSSQSMTLGIEKNFDTQLGMLTTILQYTDEQKSENDQVSFLRSIFEKAICFGIRVPVNDESDLFAASIYDTIGKSNLTRLQWNYRLSDSVTSKFSAQWLYGPEGTLLDIYNDYDSVALAINYNW